MTDEEREIEELENEEVEQKESETENTTKKKDSTIKLELDFEMDPVERLQKEIDFTESENEKAIGEFLLEEFKKDDVLKADYKANKVTLNKILGFVTNEAKKRVSEKTGAQCVMISDREVFGMVIHYVHDGSKAASKGSNDSKCILTKTEKKALEEKAREEYYAEQKRKLEEAEKKKKEKEEAARKKAIEKQKEEAEKSGQMSLFDFGD